MEINTQLLNKTEATAYESKTEFGTESIRNGFKQHRATELGRTYEYFDTKVNNYLLSQQEDYGENKDYYGKFGDLDAQEKHTYRDIIKGGHYSLEDGEIVSNNPALDYMFDMDTMKGALLSQNITKDQLDVLYKKYVDEETKHWGSKKYTTGGKVGTFIGAMGAWATDWESTLEFMTPGKIDTVSGKVIKNMGKAFGYEFAAAGVAATIKEFKPYGIRDHKKRAGIRATMKDSAVRVLGEATIAGGARAVGSGVVDKWVLRKESKLIKNQIAHEATLEKASRDLDAGKPVEVQTDIDIETKTNPEIQSVNMMDEGNAAVNTPEKMFHEEQLAKEIDEAPEFKAEDTEDDLFIQSELDDMTEDFADPEFTQLKQELDDLDREMAEYQDRINKPETPGFQAQNMTINGRTVPKTKFDLIQKYQKTRKWNRENPGQKRAIPQAQQDAHAEFEDIADGMLDMDFREDKKYSIGEIEPGTPTEKEIPEGYSVNEDNMLVSPDGQVLFAKGGDNLAAGTVAGIEEDEDGNITLDPEKFVMGLGGYTAAKAMFKAGMFDELPSELNAQVKKYFGVDLEPGITMKERIARTAELKEKTRPVGKEIYNPRVDKTYILGKDGEVYWASSRGWRKSEQFGLKQELRDIDKLGADEYMQLKERESEELRRSLKEAKEATPGTYKDQHTAPTRDQDNTTSIDDLLKVYPEDIYSKDAARLYGHNERQKDSIAMSLLRKIKGNPDAKITIYRTVPEDVDADINPGDWVTITRQYAEEHGDSRFDGKYKLLKKEVKAKEVITDGNSIHEQGYDPIEGSK